MSDATTLVPVIIHHVGSCPLYLKKCVELNALKNKVYLIGDSTNNSFGVNITHVDVGSLDSREAQVFKKYFVNYSTNNTNY
jgi:hypothetical protein